jgi:Uma2 family endonuclease
MPMSSADITSRDRPLLTAEEYARLPDDDYVTELVRGQVVREPFPSYLHASLQARLAERLVRHIREHRLQLSCTGPMGFVVERGPDTVRGPDLAVVRMDRVSSADHEGFLEAGPDLAIEIVSPSNTAADIHQKVREYLAAGTRMVWVVYPKTRTVAVHEDVFSASFLTVDDELDGREVVPDFRLRVRAIFDG